ncbi:MAG: class I SAM-dependent methyltransferase [Sarcina sp.]
MKIINVFTGYDNRGVDDLFILEYIKHPRKVGAVAPSSRFLANKMLDNIDFDNASCIVEYGPGTGAFTQRLLERVDDKTLVILLEINTTFYNKLKEAYGYKKNVIILNDGAENIAKILKIYNIKKVDYILSGLPFASLPKEVSDGILTKTYEVLEHGGQFITFQYSLVKKKLFDRFFDKISTEKTYLNIPPAYVLRCHK